MSSRSLKNRPGIKKKHPSIGVLAFLCVLLVSVVALGAGFYATVESWLDPDTLPDYTDVDAYNVAEPSYVYASDGTTLLATFQIENRDPVELDEISAYVLEATVATEDERFYEHNGIDLTGIVRALVNNLLGNDLEGASTITQQLVRNTILADEADEVSYSRKVREMYLAIKLEEIYDKNEILLMYLNTINYGNGAYGIQAAAQLYFSKDADELTLAEAATLVGIPQSPTYNNPIDYPDNCLERRDTVLERMLSNGYITQEEYDEAVAESLVLNISEDDSDDGIYMYPYFVSYVRELLLDEDGEYQYSTAEIFKGGLTIVTTLDVETQQLAEAACEAKRETLDDDIEVALVAIDPDNGYVRAMVGGSDYSESQVNLATGSGTDADDPGRPCGSAFKTFTLLAALEAGISPSTTVKCDSPADIEGYGAELQNYNNVSYGTLTIQNAFAKSSNTGFVRLEMSLGVDTVYEMAKRLGISSQLDDTDPTLTLGTYNVTMLDMANAYAAIASGGVQYDAEVIVSITDSSGEVLVDNTDPEGEQVLSEEVACAAIDVMRTVITSGTGTAAKLSCGQDAAGKTGTGSDNLDKTFCGITPQLSVAIWMGDPDNETSVTVSACDVFKNFMDAVLEDAELEDFPEADDPEYESYSDSTYDIGGSSYSSSYSSSSSSDDEAEEAEVEDDAETADAEDSASSSESESSGSDADSSSSSSGEAAGDDASGGESSSGGDADAGGDSGATDGDSAAEAAQASAAGIFSATSSWYRAVSSLSLDLSALDPLRYARRYSIG